MSESDYKSYKIKELILTHMSGPSPTCEERPIANTKEWGLLKTTAVTWNGWDWTAHKVPPQEFWENVRLEVKAGDVLVTKAGPRHRVGVVVSVDWTPPQIMVSGKMIGLRPDPDKVNYQVLAGALSQFEPQRYLDIHTTGMADSQLNFTNDLLLNTEVRLPPKPEQSKIAEILSAVNQAIEQTERLIDKQQRIKTGLLQDFLTHGIDEHGTPRSEETHEFQDSPLGRIPVEWECVPISSVLKVPPKNGFSPIESNSWTGSYMLGLGCLTVNGFRPVQLKYAPHSIVNFPKAILAPGDFLISRSNTRQLVGLVGVYKEVGAPCIYPDLIVRLVFSEDTLTEYMEQFFMSFLMRRQIVNAATGTSGSMVKINSSLIKNFLFLKPPLEEQGRIFAILNAQDTNRMATEKTQHKLRSLKTALMQDLLTGKVRVTPLLEDN